MPAHPDRRLRVYFEDKSRFGQTDPADRLYHSFASRALAVLDVGRFHQGQLDRLSQEVRPAFLRLGEVRIHGRVIADHNPLECRRIENLPQRLRIFMDADVCFTIV
jgi:hypothetical protein